MFASLPLMGQTAEVYTSYYYAPGGGTIYASSTMDAGMSSGSCTHTYNYAVGLGGPAGINQVGGGNGYWQGLTTSPYQGTMNSQIASSVAGSYNMSSSGSAFCSCVYEQYYTDPWNDPTILVTGPPTINSGGVAAYPNGGSGPISSIEPGTTGQLAIYGTYFYTPLFGEPLISNKTTELSVNSEPTRKRR